jgi:hypothetical protein
MVVGVTNHKSFVSNWPSDSATTPEDTNFGCVERIFRAAASAESADYSLEVHQSIRVVIWRERLSIAGKRKRSLCQRSEADGNRVNRLGFPARLNGFNTVHRHVKKPRSRCSCMDQAVCISMTRSSAESLLISSPPELLSAGDDCLASPAEVHCRNHSSHEIQESFARILRKCGKFYFENL